MHCAQKFACRRSFCRMGLFLPKGPATVIVIAIGNGFMYSIILCFILLALIAVAGLFPRPFFVGGRIGLVPEGLAEKGFKALLDRSGILWYDNSIYDSGEAQPVRNNSARRILHRCRKILPSYRMGFFVKKKNT
jgi:hypothetical protein